MTEERDGGNIALHIRRQIFEIGLLIENSISRLTLVPPFRSEEQRNRCFVFPFLFHPRNDSCLSLVIKGRIRYPIDETIPKEKWQLRLSSRSVFVFGIAPKCGGNSVKSARSNSRLVLLVSSSSSRLRFISQASHRFEPAFIALTAVKLAKLCDEYDRGGGNCLVTPSPLPGILAKNASLK